MIVFKVFGGQESVGVRRIYSFQIFRRARVGGAPWDDSCRQTRISQFGCSDVRTLTTSDVH